MPEKLSILVYVLAAALAGVLAQIGVTLALGIARSNTQFIGFVILSFIFSGGTTALASEVFHVPPLTAAVIGAFTGSVPALLTLRIGLRAAMERAKVPFTQADEDELRPKDKS